MSIFYCSISGDYLFMGLRFLTQASALRHDTEDFVKVLELGSKFANAGFEGKAQWWYSRDRN